MIREDKRLGRKRDRAQGQEGCSLRETLPSLARWGSMTLSVPQPTGGSPWLGHSHRRPG